MSSPNPLLEGLSDAVGFVGCALLGCWAGKLLGWNIFSAGYDNAIIGGGLHLARFCRKQKDQSPE